MMFHDATLYNLVDIHLYFKISYCLCREGEGRKHFRNFRKFLQDIGRDTPEDSALYRQHLDVTAADITRAIWCRTVPHRPVALMVSSPKLFYTPMTSTIYEIN